MAIWDPKSLPLTTCNKMFFGQAIGDRVTCECVYKCTYKCTVPPLFWHKQNNKYRERENECKKLRKQKKRILYNLSNHKIIKM